MRVAVLTLITILFASVAGAPRAVAHGTSITFSIVGDGGGRVRAAGTWGKDLHRVEEPMWALMTATPSSPDAGRTEVGPLVMVAVMDEVGVIESPEFLPVGRWKVVIEASYPATGRGEAELEVGAAAAGFPERFPQPLHEEGGSGWIVWWLWLILLGGIAAAALVVRRRPSRTQV